MSRTMMDVEKALRCAKLLSEAYGDDKHAYHAPLLAEAAQLLLNAISDLAGRGEEKELPDSAGYWWAKDLTDIYRGWKLVNVREPLWVDFKRHDLQWFYIDGSGGYNPEPGCWIKVEPPRL